MKNPVMSPGQVWEAWGEILLPVPIMCHAKKPTMKNIYLTILLLISILSCFGQSMFFDDLNRSAWTSSSDISDLTLKSYKDIPLAKLMYPRDSINKDVTIWTFRDSVLTIVKYSFQQKIDSIVGNYKYSINDKNVLQITLQDGTALKYKVGIISTGYYAVLYRTKEKKKKSKK